ncbi:MAG TPA: Ig-like domain repeat protein [Vicinamibacterales bacterium]
MRLRNSHSWCVRTCALLLFLSAHAASAQTPSPWTGVIRDDAEQEAGAFVGYSGVGTRAMSADGRFLVFQSDRTLVDGDTNGAFDVFLRDRQTGALTRVSIATDGTEGNAYSDAASISANGRHVVFRSLASNLDPTDTNGVYDLYVRDLDTGVTSLVTVGPSGERLACNCVPVTVGRLSGDGRFVVFSAEFSFPVPGPEMIWLRDRDADQNGVFDEPGSATTTGVEVETIEGLRISGIQSVAISNDARYIAFSADAFGENGTPMGIHIYLHDRTLGTLTRVDRPLPGFEDVNGRSLMPEFSDNGQLAYTSTVPNLVADDADAFADVFVYDIATATNTRLRLTHINAAFTDAYGAAISADGRFVAFTGYENDGAGTERWNVYAIDRELHESFDISVRTDGSRDNGATGASMSADGSAIAFTGNEQIIRDYIGGIGGVFVRTAVSMTSTVTEVPMEGGFVPVDIVVPADTFWKALLVAPDSSGYGYTQYSTYSGIGPGTLNVEIPFDILVESVTYQLWLGSEAVTFHQQLRPILYSIIPSDGPTTGGTPFQLYGFGFQDGASVKFDGVPATNIVVDEGGNLIHGVTPPHFATVTELVVTNPNGGASSVEQMFFGYDDETPPVVTAVVTGALGANGWYTSDVVVHWNIVETDSDLFEVPCANSTQTADVTSRVFTCVAISGGGQTTQQVVIKRDATPPSISIAQPQAQIYRQGQTVPIDFSCSDATSGIASCTANQAGTLNTSTPGTFSFIVSAVDHAGNTSQSSISYTVKAKVDTGLSLSSSPNPSKPNQEVTVTATVSALAPDSAVLTGVVEFRVNGVLVGTAPLVNGIASVTVTFKKGSYSLTATYVGDANFNGSSGTVLHKT